MVDFSGLRIKLASPQDIKDWSHGEITKPETINYRTLKPEKDGLFCERIFGPTKDWECYCGKYKRIRYRGIICDKCGVEVTQSRVRRERMGHIDLASPVAHIWFFKGSPSKISLLLDLSPRGLESVVYFAQYLVSEVDEKKKEKVIKRLDEALMKKKKSIKTEREKAITETNEKGGKEKEKLKKEIKDKDRRLLALEEVNLKSKQKIQALRDQFLTEGERAEEVYQAIINLVKGLKEKALLSEDEYLKLTDYHAVDFFKVSMGAEALEEAIKRIDLEKLAADLRKTVKESKGARHIKAIKRLQVVESFRKAEIEPEWMILKILPVIPPDLRPMVQLSGGRFATSDLNDLYRRVINRNNRLKHLMDLGAPEIILRNEKRMLQEAVDTLIDAAKRPIRRYRRTHQPLRSLSDMLRGKQGRFRQNLLGKRVDYSGRSVIVVGPELKLNQCGLPKEMALEMFKPFVLREMILAGVAPNVKNAKNVLEQRPPEVFDILERITKDHPVLLNRAPTLHKLGIQAFYPVLIEGEAIQIHPCVTQGYNADFDGDQMAVHVPLSEKAKKESLELMAPDKNLLKPSDGSPITIPNHEMALGCFFVTSINDQLPINPTIFVNKEEAILAYQEKKVDLRQLIRVRIEAKIIESSPGRLIFNQILPPELTFVNDVVRGPTIKALVTRAMQVCENQTVVDLIDNIKKIGFWASTLSGLSVGIWDCITFENKEEIIDQANQRVAQIEENYNRGLITNQEKRRLTHEIWMETTEELADKTWEKFDSQNSVRLIVEAKVGRASKEQVKQLSAMQGLVVDPMGKIVELPVKSNFREGLSVFEYINSARGSRKGLTDTALKTSDAGYLTRRLVDVAHEVIVRKEDCGTKESIVLERAGKRGEKFLDRVLGRVLAKPVVAKNKKVILKKGELITENNVGLLEKQQINKIWVRSPLTCESKYGVCVQCYGWDFSAKAMVEKGTPVGVVAAQSIGEPGTQLTLRTKHFGGIVVSDVTQGLPRVEELFEARKPKVLAPLAEIAGKVSVDETEDGYRIRIKSVGIKPVEEREYLIPLVSEVKVSSGELVDAGTQLASGSLDVREVMEIKGLKAAQEYLIEEVQLVYESQGIPIQDKHFEVIVRKMSDKVRIETSGDTSLLPGQFVSRAWFEGENAKVLAEGGEPASAQVVILGITRSSISTDSWLSAASFERTTNVLADAAIEGKEDRLLGLKENVIIGRLIPVTPERAQIKE
ncbi:MAG: DNA-directed RNA polymerase subunit beta' [Candidatus Marinimicrobia bacterium]|nr:DNA-directed RNA polymerase subunit beta' [Candidatus Neomarinimicrobiota bacterium]